MPAPPLNEDFRDMLERVDIVYQLGRDALLRNKRASGRPKDLADALALEESES